MKHREKLALAWEIAAAKDDCRAAAKALRKRYGRMPFSRVDAISVETLREFARTPEGEKLIERQKREYRNYLLTVEELALLTSGVANVQECSAALRAERREMEAIRRDLEALRKIVYSHSESKSPAAATGPAT